VADLAKKEPHLQGAFSGSQAGFTLVEVALAVLLTGILAGVVFRLLQASETGFSAAWSVTEFDRESEKALSRMASDFRAAQDTSLVNDKVVEIAQYDRTCRYEIVTAHHQHLIYRKLDEGSGWVTTPKAPVARFSVDPSDSALTFSCTKGSHPWVYQIQLVSAKRTAQARIYQRF